MHENNTKNNAYGYIYKITNIVNNKIYVGKTEDSPEARLRDHISQAMRNLEERVSYFHRAIRKYGYENFVTEEIDVAYSFEELNEKEIYWIDKLNATNSNIGYNLTDGGTGGNTLKYLSEEEKQVRLLKIKTTKDNKSEEEKLELHERLSKSSKAALRKLYDSGYENNNKGMVWCNNGIINKMVTVIPDGFVKGRIKTDKLMNGVNAMKRKHEETGGASLRAAKGKHWYNNGVEEISAYECPQGYINGRIKRKRNKKKK